MLVKLSVPTPTIDWLSGKGCVSMELYATWADDLAGWTKVAEKSPTKDDDDTAPRLKAAWEKVCAITARRDAKRHKAYRMRSTTSR